MPAEEIFKFCFTCRRETLHRLVPQISSRALYQCSTPGCSAPVREVSNAEERTPAAVAISKATEKAVEKKFEKENKKERPYKPRAPKIKEIKTMPKGIAKNKPQSPLLEAINKIVDERIKVPTMTPDDVRLIVQEELNAALGLNSGAHGRRTRPTDTAAPSTSPSGERRGSGRGSCGKCGEAGHNKRSCTK